MNTQHDDQQLHVMEEERDDIMRLMLINQADRVVAAVDESRKAIAAVIETLERQQQRPRIFGDTK